MKALLLIIGLLMSSITAVHAQTVDYDKKLKELGIELPSASPPAANYVKAVRVGDVLHLSGHAAVSGFHGKLGKDMTTEQGYQAARSTAVSVLATLKQELGDLNRVKRIVKVMGMVNSTPEYTEQPGDQWILRSQGRRVRRQGKARALAVGMGALPFNFAVEIDLVVEVE
jgi:enamine deaminase RidA (YjgF/YER057c/UK114 family)